MKLQTLFLTCLVASLFSFGVSDALSVEPSEMAAKLCRAGGGEWTRVVPVTVRNDSNAAYSERSVSIPIAASGVDGALPLNDETVQSLRVCNSDGKELLFNVADERGRILTKGAIPQKSRLTLPVTVEPGKEATYYVFAGNPAAYPNPDILDDVAKIPTNLDFEYGSEKTPDGWIFDGTDPNHRLTWTTRRTYGESVGNKCVLCEVDSDQNATWVAARQLKIRVVPGERYRFEALVRGENVKGNVGWYLHLGNAGNHMISSPMLYVGKEGDFTWTKVSREFTAGEDIDLVDFGTVLYGTGKAWFDSASFVRLGADGEPVEFDVFTGSDAVRIDAEIALPTRNIVDPGIAPEIIASQRRYATIRVDANEGGARLVSLDLAAIETRWNRKLDVDDFEILDVQNHPVDVQTFGGRAFFNVELVAGARNCLHVVEKTEPGAAATSSVAAERVAANQAFPGTMLQNTDVESDAVVEKSLTLPEFIRAHNLVDDGDFENTSVRYARADVEVWTHDAPEPDVEYSIVNSGIPALGKSSLKIAISDAAPRRWRGWRRRVPVTPNQTYLVGYAIKTESLEGSRDLYMHWRRDDGALADAGMTSLGKPVSSGSDWTLLTGSARASSDATILELHLTSQNPGVAFYDSVFVVATEQAELVEFGGGRTGVFQVPAVAKVFRDTTFAPSALPVSEDNRALCSLALEEEETLQLAFRLGAGDARSYDVRTSEPILRGGTAKLGAPDVFVVSNVLVDYPTNYYQGQGAPTERRFPTGTPGCDGWIGYWPDPLIPVTPDNISHDAALNAARMMGALSAPENWNDSQRVSLAAFDGRVVFEEGTTRALWLRARTTASTTPGIYDGVLTLTANDKTMEIPYSVEVLNFTAPRTSVTGIYDARISHDYFGAGSRQEKLERVAEKLLERKLSPDKLVADPVFRYDAATGNVAADWNAFDADCVRYFDELGGKAAYFPLEFYLFGWGVPPKVVEGENPYPGEWPYDGADRATLRPEYKKAYQAKLRLFWDHLKEKGWSDRFVLYISDEPFYSKPEIIEQMKALCDMIHEVDPAIPIYSSTWVFVPEWLGYLDVWGVGHYGAVSEESLAKIRDAGGRVWWTTDGQMCLDTPLCATERLLPYSCVRHGAELYEFWGATWFTCDPFESASHLYISQSDQPGVRYYIRYPNGDGYIFYPGELIGREGEIVDSIRSEQAREGVEDAGWLVGLQRAISDAPDSPEKAEAQRALDRALALMPLDCGSGRYSTRYLSDTWEFERIRRDVGLALEKLSQ